MPFALISHIYYMQSFLSCVKVYSMVLLNIHLRDGLILLSKKQKKNEQCWNMAYDCIFSHLLARILLFWWDWEWQIYTARLSSALNKSKESLTGRSQIHTCGTSLFGVLQACVEVLFKNVFIYSLQGWEKSEFKNWLPFSLWAGTIWVATSYIFWNWIWISMLFII